MSARVFNPLVLSEMRRVIGRSNSDSSPAAVASVRRDLFGPINHEEAQSFVDRELAVMRKRESDKWGFDFEKETPLDNSRFNWERVTPEHNIPEAYALRRLTSLLGQKQSEETMKDASTNTASTTSKESSPKAKSAAKQAQITDFLKCRKRSLSAGDISRQKVANMTTDDISSIKVGTTASLSKPSKCKRSRTRQRQ